MRALVFVGAGEMALHERPDPEPGPGDVVVAVRAAGICGSDVHAGSIFVAGVSSPTLARNDLWTIPGQEAMPERWAIEDQAALAAVDLESHYHELQLRDVVGAIRDRRPAAIDGRDGRATVELFWAIYRASRTGRRIRLGSRLNL